MSASVPVTLDDVIASVREYMWLPDPGPVIVVLAAVVANLLQGDPTWLILVGAPSSGKTELLNMLLDLADVHEISETTRAGLLSGSAVADGDTEATGGVLEQIARSPHRYGLLLFKDFTTTLSTAAESRGEILALLREVFDGRVSRSLGTKGGRIFKWRNCKAGALAACTGVIDTVDMGLMGDRPMYYRYPDATPDDSRTAARMAMGNSGRERDMRAVLAAKVAAYVAGLDLDRTEAPPSLSPEETDDIIDLATLAVKARSSVIYRRNGEVSLVPVPEEPPRLAAQLCRMAGVMARLGVDAVERRRLLTELALGGVHKDRRAVLTYLARYSTADMPRSTKNVAVRVRIDPDAAREHLQGLTALGLVEWAGSERDNSEAWHASDLTAQLWPSTECVSDASEPVAEAAPKVIANVAGAIDADPFDFGEEATS